ISPLRPPPRGPTLFPYTTLFRSEDADCRADEARAGKDEEHRKRRWKCRAEPSEYHPPHRKERRDHSDGDEEIGAAQHRHEVLELAASSPRVKVRDHRQRGIDDRCHSETPYGRELAGDLIPSCVRGTDQRSDNDDIHLCSEDE